MSDGGLWLLLGALLLASGAFSSSETALFSLKRSERGRAGGAAQRLLARPRDLLVTVLLGNLLVNLLFFAFVGRLAPYGSRSGVAVGLGALVAVLVVGEIIPKTIGLRSRVRVARISAPVLIVLVGLIRPLRRILIRALELVNRLVDRFVAPDRGLTPEALEKVLERGAEEGHLLDMEADLLAEIVELDDIRVREIMTPRVDTLFIDVTGRDRERLVEEALRIRQSWLPVIDGNPDRVVGRVKVVDLARRVDQPVRRLVMPIKFVPEVASALDLLRSLRADRAAEAVVVDEWGGTAGYVTLEDVFEEIVGDLREEGESRSRPAVPLGEGRFRVAGSLSIRDWNEAFGFRVVPTEFETVGGFVTALLGRIPRAGDLVRWGELEMEVHEVRGRRVLAVDIAVVSDAAAQAAGGGPAEEAR